MVGFYSPYISFLRFQNVMITTNNLRPFTKIKDNIARKASQSPSSAIDSIALCLVLNIQGL